MLVKAATWFDYNYSRITFYAWNNTYTFQVTLRPIAENKPRLDYKLYAEDSPFPEIMLVSYAATNLTEDEDHISLIEVKTGLYIVKNIVGL